MKLYGKLSLIIILLAVDQLSKYWVEQNLPFQSGVPFIPFISLYRTYNEGIAFSGLDFIGNEILTVLIILVIAFVIWLWKSMTPERKFAHWGYAFVVAGALGNLIDRAIHAHVIDFIQFHTQNWSFAIFNLADAFITMGAALIIMDEVIQSRKTGTGENNE